MGADISVEGLDGLQSKINGDKIIQDTAKDALTKAAIIVTNQAKLNASGRPGPNVQTGRLRKSIAWQLDGAALPAWAKVGTNVEYAPFVEFGTRRMKAYPFLNPALEQKQDEISDILGDAAKAVEAEWGRK
ncbi:MAG: HK97-gp10 family putative phage morphogenesis protein [Dehalococcoides mccartyi]